jgi:ribosome biogenesis protein ERB1
MAPRSASANGQKARNVGQAGPSRLPAQTAKPAKKRAVEEVEDEEDEDDDDFELNGEGLDVSEEEDGDDEAVSEGEDEEDFPELDSGSEDEEMDEAEADNLDADTEEEEDLDDEESGSESGYNSSDIDAMYSSAPTSPQSVGKELSVDEKLSRLVAKNTIKPDESIGTDAKISRAKEGTGKLRPSKLVPGGYLREYDDIEAGYGSESSTEDVSGREPH